MTPEQAQLVQDNIATAQRVASVLSRKYGTYYTYDECYSICLESLCRSASSYDMAKSDVSFERFAVMRMYNFIIDTFRKEQEWDKHKRQFKFRSVSFQDFISDSSMGFESTGYGDKASTPLYNDEYGFEIVDQIKRHLAQLPERDQQVVLDFANGGINYAAQRHGLTKGRVSQIRTKARQQWENNQQD